MKKFVLAGGLLLALLALLAGCAAPPADGTQGGFDWALLVFLVLIVAVFYFLMVRPQRKRQQQQRQMMRELQKGDQVITAGGIYGVIDSLDENSVVIKVESGATLRVARSSIVVRQPR